MRLVFSTSGTSPETDALRQAFHNRGFADPGLTNQYWVILRAARQNLHPRGESLRLAR